MVRGVCCLLSKLTGCRPAQQSIIRMNHGARSATFKNECRHHGACTCAIFNLRSPRRKVGTEDCKVRMRTRHQNASKGRWEIEEKRTTRAAYYLGSHWRALGRAGHEGCKGRCQGLIDRYWPVSMHRRYSAPGTDTKHLDSGSLPHLRLQEFYLLYLPFNHEASLSSFQISRS